MKDLMIDLETLDTVATGVILSIGMVPFDLEKGKIIGDGFYTVVDIDSNLAVGRTVSGSTLSWWMTQAGAAKQEVFAAAAGDKMQLEEMLLAVQTFIGNHQPRPWSNGADFDIPMLSHAFGQFNMKTPWAFWNSRCFRTWKNLPGAEKATVPQVTLKHHALADAAHQAEHAINIYNTVFKGKK